MDDQFFQMCETSDIPRELRADLLIQLERVRHLIPLWVTAIRIYYEPNPPADMAKSNAGIHVQTEYRYGLLYIYPRWLRLNDVSRHACLVHEMSHFPARTLVDLAYDLAKNYAPNEATKRILFEQIRRASENAAEDTKLMILRTEQLTKKGSK